MVVVIVRGGGQWQGLYNRHNGLECKGQNGNARKLEETMVKRCGGCSSGKTSV